jgi:heme/copper-type cytochrome/quinol oxidase subunit 2
MYQHSNVIEFSSLMGLPKAGNDIMYSIVILLSEMSVLLSYIFFGVLLALAYIVDVFNSDSNPLPRHFEKTIESTLDVIFVIFPTIIIIYLLIPSLGFVFNNEVIYETAFDINIIGHQWYWSYEYVLSLGSSIYGLLTDQMAGKSIIEFDSLLDQEATFNRLLQVDKRVLIPSNTMIQGCVTSQDVIHSWAVPQLGIKYDAVPGRLINFIIYSDMNGVFYGQCSELCGVNHAFMPICIQSVDYDIFIDWVLISFGTNPSSEILKQLYLHIDKLFSPDLSITPTSFGGFFEYSDIIGIYILLSDIFYNNSGKIVVAAVVSAAIGSIGAAASGPGRGNGRNNKKNKSKDKSVVEKNEGDKENEARSKKTILPTPMSKRIILFFFFLVIPTSFIFVYFYIFWHDIFSIVPKGGFNF